MGWRSLICQRWCSDGSNAISCIVIPKNRTRWRMRVSRCDKSKFNHCYVSHYCHNLVPVLVKSKHTLLSFFMPKTSKPSLCQIDTKDGSAISPTSSIPFNLLYKMNETMPKSKFEIVPNWREFNQITLLFLYSIANK